MFRKLAEVLGTVVLCVAILLVVLVAVLIISWSPTLWSEKAAAWVQAIGSISAIIGAVLLANWQHRSAEIAKLEQLRDERVEALQALHEIIVHARHGITTVTFEPTSNLANLPGFDERRFQHTYQTLKNIPLHLPIYFPVVRPALNAIEQVGRALEVIQWMNSPENFAANSSPAMIKLSQISNDLVSTYREIKAAIKAEEAKRLRSR
jgi:hypothetical protein